MDGTLMLNQRKLAFEDTFRKIFKFFKALKSKKRKF